MTKIIDITHRNLNYLQSLVENNPTWDLITCGQTQFSETHTYKSARGPNVMYSDPTKEVSFAVFKSQPNGEAFNQ